MNVDILDWCIQLSFVLTKELPLLFFVLSGKIGTVHCGFVDEHILTKGIEGGRHHLNLKWVSQLHLLRDQGCQVFTRVHKVWIPVLRRADSHICFDFNFDLQKTLSVSLRAHVVYILEVVLLELGLPIRNYLISLPSVWLNLDSFNWCNERGLVVSEEVSNLCQKLISLRVVVGFQCECNFESLKRNRAIFFKLSLSNQVSVSELHLLGHSCCEV